VFVCLIGWLVDSVRACLLACNCNAVYNGVCIVVLYIVTHSPVLPLWCYYAPFSIVDQPSTVNLLAPILYSAHAQISPTTN